jgi:hypothetical protein
MNRQNLLAKLNQIVEHAQLTLQDPDRLASERQKQIIALARYVSAEVAALGRPDLGTPQGPPPLT